MPKLCGLCEEVVDDHLYHPTCCPHDIVETDDGRDGQAGRIRSFCESCGAEVIPEPDEDNFTYWEIV